MNIIDGIEFKVIRANIYSFSNKVDYKILPEPLFFAFSSYLNPKIDPLEIKNETGSGKTFYNVEDIIKSINQNINEPKMVFTYDGVKDASYIYTIRDCKGYKFIGDIRIKDSENINNKILELLKTKNISVYLKEEKETYYRVCFENVDPIKYSFFSNSINLIDDSLFIQNIQDCLNRNKIHNLEIENSNDVLDALNIIRCLIY